MRNDGDNHTSEIRNPQSTIRIDDNARGNTTTIPQPSDLTASYAAAYDAWNRLVEVKDGDNVVLKCEYDGLGRQLRPRKPGPKAKRAR